MDAAFLLRIRRTGGPALDPLPAIDSQAIGFEPVGSGSWSSAAGDIELVVWWGPRRAGGGALHGEGGAATFVVGDVRWQGEQWADPTRWAELLASRAATADPLATQGSLAGVYSAGHLRADGSGWLISDPLGLRCTYWSAGHEVTVAGSRAALVAAARPGATPTIDLDALTWLAYTSYWVGDRTGWDGIELAPAGWVGAIADGRLTWSPGLIDHVPSPTRPADALGAEEAASEVIAEVAAGLEAAAARPGDHHIIQLTGGRDSRLLLAVALSAGLADRFHFETAGPERLDDVRVARQLADRYGLRHRVRFFGMRPDQPLLERQRWWVRDVGGMVSGWEAPGPALPDVRVTGVGGEFLRSYRRIRAEPTPTLDGRRVVARARPGRLGLVLAASAQARAQELARAVRPDGQPFQAFRNVHLFYARNRMRFTRLGPRQEVLAEERLLPLYAPRCVAAALGVWAPDRQEGAILDAVLRQTVPALADHRYAGGGLSAPSAPSADATGGVPDAPTSDGGATEHRSLVASLFSRPSDERSELIGSVLADGDNPAWQVLDRRAAIEAAARWEALDVVERRELFGAVSAALWAADPR